MKKRIVINVPMHNDKAKSKAMKIVVDSPGVVSVSLGEERDQLVVIGEGVDSVSLANSLRKNFCFANIISLDDVKPAEPESKPSPSPAGSCTPPPSSPAGSCTQPPPIQCCPPPPPPPVQYCPPPPYWPPVYYAYRPVYDDPPNCSIF